MCILLFRLPFSSLIFLFYHSHFHFLFLFFILFVFIFIFFLFIRIVDFSSYHSFYLFLQSNLFSFFHFFPHHPIVLSFYLSIYLSIYFTFFLPFLIFSFFSHFFYLFRYLILRSCLLELMNKEIILPKLNISQTCPREKEKEKIVIPAVSGYDDYGTQNNGRTKARYSFLFIF